MVWPGARPVTKPEASTEASVLSAVFQETSAVRSWKVPSEKIPVAVYGWPVREARVVEAAWSLSLLRAAELTLTDPLVEVTPSSEAVTWVLPGFPLLARPSALMVRMVGSLEAQTTALVMSTAEPVSKWPMAVNCWVVPCAMDGVPGRISMESSLAGKESTLMEAVRPPKLPVICAAPEDSP